MAKESKTLDFTNVKDGGGAFNKKRQPEGDYSGKIIKVQTVKIKDKPKESQWLFTLEVGTGKYPYYCQFTDEALWKIRNLFVAAGITVPKKKVSVDPNKVVGKTIGVTLQDDEYNDKKQSSIESVFPASELDKDEDDDDEDEDDDDDEDEEEDDEDEEDSDDEEEEEEEEDEEPEPPKKKKKSKKAAMDELDIDDI